MHSHRSLATALATAFLRGPWTVDALSGHAEELLGRRWRWIHPLARRVVAAPLGIGRPRHAAVAAFILHDPGFNKACRKHDLRIKNPLGGPPGMCPAECAQRWQLPPLCTAEELAGWLGIDGPALDWLADHRRNAPRLDSQRLAHYRYRPVSKRFGQLRLIEVPKPRLKLVQRRILTGILDQVPPHAAAHGFRRGGSICTFAAPHVGRQVVVRLDLRDFFPSVSRARVAAVFRTLGYPEPVANLLARLCTNATSDDVWPRSAGRDAATLHDACRRYAQPHLPQGAPTSPALANLCAYRLDCRLAALAHAAAATYTRYADDLAFSGDEPFRRSAKRFHLHAAAVVMDEGFAVHFRKTRLMRRGARQQLAGLVVNQRLNIRRSDYDRFKAILTNCVRHGPESQNRDRHVDFRRHLEGRIAFVRMINPDKAQKLMQLFERIRW